MKKLLHLFLFLMAFQMEVRVRASEGALSLPENCLGKTVPCSFKVNQEKWSHHSGTVKLRAVSRSVLTEEVKNKEWRLLEGTLWVENAPSVKIHTINADAEASNGQYWVLIENDRVIFRNISSKLTLTFKDQSKMEIPRGFEVWVGSVNSEARVEHGMVEPINLKKHLKVWNELYPGSKEQFVTEVQDLRDQWSDLVEESGDIYKKVAEKRLLAQEEEKRREREARKEKEQERRLLRESFHRRVFEY